MPVEGSLDQWSTDLVNVIGADPSTGDDRQSILTQLEQKLNKQRKMVEGVDRLLEADIVNPGYEIRANSRRQEFEEKIRVIEAAINDLRIIKKEGLEMDDISFPFCHLINSIPLSLPKLAFQITMAREKIQQEKMLLKWAEKSAHEINNFPKRDRASWLNTDPDWQAQLACGKFELLQRQLKDIQKFFDLRAISQHAYPSSPIDGEIRVKVASVMLMEESYNKNDESLLIQIWIDGWASKPYKLKRNGDCEVTKIGLARELYGAKCLEVLVFDKHEKLLGFCAFRLSWLQDYMETTFDRTLKDRLDLIPNGTIELDIVLHKNSLMKAAEDSSEGKIVRRPAIHYKTIERLGHVFAPSSRQGLARILKCSHCGDHIYGRNGVKCTRCRFASHRNCIKEVFVKCIADPNFERWEALTRALSSRATPHQLVGWPLRTPSFCDHCGKIMPIGTNAVDCLKCTSCHKFFHAHCEPYIPVLCGLKRTDAMLIARDYIIGKAVAESPSQDIKPFIKEKSLKWTLYELKNFEFISVIGKGNFGKVMLVRNKDEGKLYALKILKKQQIIENGEFDSVKAEYATFELVSQTDKCPFLVQCHGFFQSADRLFLLMDFVAGGDLMFHIQSRKFTLDQVRLIAAQVLLALEFLHSHGILYRDLKLDNILVDLNGHIKLTDYGLCKINMKGSQATTTTFCGTPEFMAPEILQERPYGMAVDWWAFGIFLYEMLQYRAPFHGKNEQETFHRILTSTLFFTTEISPDAKDLIQKLLVRDPGARLGGNSSGGTDGEATEIRQHPFFANLDWNKVRMRAIESTFKPQIMAPTDVSNFEKQFTQERPLLTPIPSLKKLSPNHESFFASLL